MNLDFFFLIFYYRGEFGSWGSVITFIEFQTVCIDFIKQPAMTVCSQVKKAIYMHFVIAVNLDTLGQANKVPE